MHRFEGDTALELGYLISTTLHFSSLFHLLLPSPFSVSILSPVPIVVIWDIFCFSPLDFQIQTISCSILHLYGPLLH